MGERGELKEEFLGARLTLSELPDSPTLVLLLHMLCKHANLDHAIMFLCSPLRVCSTAREKSPLIHSVLPMWFPRFSWAHRDAQNPGWCPWPLSSLDSPNSYLASPALFESPHLPLSPAPLLVDKLVFCFTRGHQTRAPRTSSPTANSFAHYLLLQRRSYPFSICLCSTCHLLLLFYSVYFQPHFSLLAPFL